MSTDHHPTLRHAQKTLIPVITAAAILLFTACGSKTEPEQFVIEVLNGYTPIKDQGDSQTCWAYAMLAAIETDRITMGDSVNLSPAWIESHLKDLPGAPRSGRGMGITAINILSSHGIVGYEAMRRASDPRPSRVFLYGVEYTPQEFANSICLKDDYTSLCTIPDQPYFTHITPPLQDNWEHNSMLNLPPDSLLRLTDRAVRAGHGVCWEGDITERGFNRHTDEARLTWPQGSTSDNHCMAIVGIAHDSNSQPFFIMKNSWGKNRPHGGLFYMAYDYFKEKTIAVFLKSEK